MKALRIYNEKLGGEVSPPHSKSYLHRYIIAAAMAEGKTELSGFELNRDIEDTLNALSLKTTYKIKNNAIEIMPCSEKFSKEIRIRESASTLRMLFPLLFDGEEHLIHLDKKLYTRPMNAYKEILKNNDIFSTFDNVSQDIRVKGVLKQKKYFIRGDISSQFISGMLFKLPTMDFDTEIIIKNKLQSESYVNMTIETLKDFNIYIEKKDNSYIIKGCQKYESKGKYEIERDYSQAAYFYCANFMGSDIKVDGMSENSIQGDRRIKDILELFKKEENLIIDGSDNPDLIPILVLSALFRRGETVFRGIGRLRYKESDRILSTVEELNKLNADITSENDEIRVKPVSKLSGSIISDSRGDHRIAMMIAMAAQRASKPITLYSYSAVEKSYPNFFNDFIKLGGKFDVVDCG